ncbi:DHHC-type zinc finger family protein [Trifolium repens]|nr:DHHC-type zinc finger family protein [Trifolium repens]
MIKPFYTVITDRAVRASRRPIKHASIAILDLYNNAIDINLLNPWQPQLRSLTSTDICITIKTFWFWRMCIAWYYARISTRC